MRGRLWEAGSGSSGVSGVDGVGDWGVEVRVGLVRHVGDVRLCCVYDSRGFVCVCVSEVDSECRVLRVFFSRDYGIVGRFLVVYPDGGSKRGGECWMPSGFVGRFLSDGSDGGWCDESVAATSGRVPAFSELSSVAESCLALVSRDRPGDRSLASGLLELPSGSFSSAQLFQGYNLCDYVLRPTLWLRRCASLSAPPAALSVPGFGERRVVSHGGAPFRVAGAVLSGLGRMRRAVRRGSGPQPSGRVI